ncbi:MAG: hydrogenase maturation protease [Roseicyclus sp.]
MTDTVVIAVGHGHRGDDGVGAACLRNLAARRVDAALVHARADPGDLARGMLGRRRAFVIDAARLGGTPGQIRTFDLRDPTLAERMRPRQGMGLLEAVALVRGLHGLPEICQLIVVESPTLGYGERLSPPVAAAVRRVTEGVTRACQHASDRLDEAFVSGPPFD